MQSQLIEYQTDTKIWNSKTNDRVDDTKKCLVSLFSDGGSMIYVNTGESDRLVQIKRTHFKLLLTASWYSVNE